MNLDPTGFLELHPHGGFAAFGGVGIGIALLLLIALRVLLPKSERHKIRAPAWLLALHLLLTGLRALIPVLSSSQKPLGVAAIFFLLACLARGGFLLAVDWFLGKRRARPLSKIFRDIIQVFVYVGVALLTLRAMGVAPGSLLTTSALLTAVIGLSLQETLGNLFAGLAIQAQHPFSVGDWVQFESDETCIGQVTEINWRATKVLTEEMVEVIVPNGTLAKAHIRNFTQPTLVSRRSAIVSGPYEAPPAKVEDALFDAIRGARNVLADPPPRVILKSFGNSGIDYHLQYFIDEFARRHEIDARVRSRIWYAFQRAGISIPFPIRDVRMTDAAKVATELQEQELGEREAALHHVDFLDALPDVTLRGLAEGSEVRLYSAGEDVIRQGESGDELFIVLRGEATVLVARDGREPGEVARLAAGKFFGEMSLLTGEKRTATVRAGHRLELLVVGHDAFRRILADAPELAERISSVLARRQAQLEEHEAVDTTTAKEPVAHRDRVLLTRIKALFSL
jgi:small-conductance mechanosensitive channel